MSTPTIPWRSWDTALSTHMVFGVWAGWVFLAVKAAAKALFLQRREQQVRALHGACPRGARATKGSGRQDARVVTERAKRVEGSAPETTTYVDTANESVPTWRRLPIGAEIATDGGVHFRVWAPRRRTVDVVLFDRDDTSVRVMPLARNHDGYFSGVVEHATTGSRYRYRLDGTDDFPDPASRFQPNGPHGASEVTDPDSFSWTDDAWRGPTCVAPVLYEMHIGTFTTAGTWAAATAQLTDLADLGVTILEIMPVAEFPGRFGWGYDGVDLFAPYHGYGLPDDFKAFVNRAHSLQLGVILDVVYNHFGPDGNYTAQFSDGYCSTRHHTDWGMAINFDAAGSEGVREFYLANVEYWIKEFHLDGLRVDATQAILDDSSHHILAAITETVHASAGGRETYVVAENEQQDVTMLRAIEHGGYGIDALWNDDWHHSAMVSMKGRDEAYYSNYAGSSREFVAAAKFGFLYQGQWASWQGRRRGVAGLNLKPRQFVHFLENHDQVANYLRGERLCHVASAAKIRAMTALLLLGPQTPMLFQGQEFGASNPFHYLADHDEPLMSLVRDGRSTFLNQFQSVAAQTPPNTSQTDPGADATFVASKLDHDERTKHVPVHALHKDLIRLRREDAVLNGQREYRIEGATLTDNAFILRYLTAHGDDRLLLLNLGAPLHMRIMPEPLLAPPKEGPWSLQWTSEDPRYGGLGLPTLDPSMNGWIIPGDCAVLFSPTRPTEP